ncbi:MULTISPECIES: hypothetical protein [unclassified Pseudomonas]|uniref:DUF2946 domain-containing protein n=1 Tax=Pseudomonas sp. MYb327 TaxID=2745230 RepID=A0AAU8E663_9PSED
MAQAGCLADRLCRSAGLFALTASLATISPSVLLAGFIYGEKLKPFAINGNGSNDRNYEPCERCVTVLNHPGDKKPSPQTASLPSPPALLRLFSMSWMELFFCPVERPKAHKTRASEENNVPDLEYRISFFWHKLYEK